LTENRGVLQSVKTIFVGGGTPSALSVSELEQLLAMILENVGSGFVEWTMESNPESLSPAKIALMHKFGVNRVSMGVQSFNEVTRKNIGRIGSVLMVDKAVFELNRVGITNINFDLIFGSKGQTAEMWLADLEQACSYPITHLSTYSLSIEVGSALEKEAMEVDDDLAVDFMQLTCQTLERKGFKRYEISNFSKTGYCCLHNDGIWHGETYLGLGPAAASYDGRDRWQEVGEVLKWLAGENAEKDCVSLLERAREVFVIGLRTIDGWSLDDFEKKTGVSLSELYSTEVNDLVEKGFLIMENDRIYSSPRGLLYADYIAVDLI
jgi:oxygen-independent coproporphyrinogen-3 oxidase